MNMINATKNGCQNSKIIPPPKLIHDIFLNVKISKSLNKHNFKENRKMKA